MQEKNEDKVTVINTALDSEEVQQASQENPDINKEKDRLLAEFVASKTRLKEKLARVKAQVKAISQLENAINRLESCVNDHRLIVSADLPVGPILETKQDELKEAGVSNMDTSSLCVIFLLKNNTYNQLLMYNFYYVDSFSYKVSISPTEFKYSLDGV